MIHGLDRDLRARAPRCDNAPVENIAHTLLGLAVAKAGLEKKGAMATTTLVLGSNLPDVDAIALIQGKLAYIEAHRGLSHSLVGASVLGVAFGTAVWGFDRWVFARLRPGSVRMRLGSVVGLTLLGVFLHLVLDFLNDYGVRLLLPFSSTWFYGDVVFVVDPWFWLLLGSALHVGLPRRRLSEALVWIAWSLLSLPVLLDSVVTVPARIVWCLGLIGLGTSRLLGARRLRGPELEPPSQEPPRGRRANQSSPSVFPVVGERSPQPLDPSAVQPGAARVNGVTFESSSKVSESRRRAPCQAALAMLVLYVGCAWALHTFALRRVVARESGQDGAARARRVALLPMPADPVHWNLIYEREGKIVATPFSSWKEAAKLPPPRVFTMNLDRPEVMTALSTPVGQVARGFCRYLFADLRETPSGPLVAFRDARFAIRGRHEFSVFEVPSPSSGTR